MSTTPAPMALPTTAGPPVRVLVVEDDPRVRQGLRRLLASTPDLRVVAEADRSADARRAVTAVGPDCALVAVRSQAPGDRIELVRELARALPVIATSPDAGARGAALGAGAMLYLEQGGDPEVLVAALRGLPARP